MKLPKKYKAALMLLLTPLLAQASIPRGPSISDTDIVMLLAIVLLIMSNGILALINILWKKRGVRIYNLIVTGGLLVCAVGMFFVDFKAGAISLFIVLLHGLLIFLSVRRKAGKP